MRLSDLFQEADSFLTAEKTTLSKKGISGLSEDTDRGDGKSSARQSEAKHFDFSRMTRQHGVIEDFKKQVKSSLNLIHNPKTALFYSHAARPIIAKAAAYLPLNDRGTDTTRSDYEKKRVFQNKNNFQLPPTTPSITSKYALPRAHQGDTAKSSNNIGIASTPSSSQGNYSSRVKVFSREKNIFALKDDIEMQIPKKTSMTLKLSTNLPRDDRLANYNINMNNSHGRSLTPGGVTSSSQTELKRVQLSETLLSRTASKQTPRKMTIDQRVRMMNNKFYLDKLLPTNTSSESLLPFRSSKAIATEPSDDHTNNHYPNMNTQLDAPPKFCHKMLSSICMAQIKPIKGGHVKKAEKEKFQNYYDSVSERLMDFRNTRTLNEYEIAKKNQLDWSKIRYQPANQDQKSSMQELRQLYQREKNFEIQRELDMLITQRGKEDTAKNEKIQQLKEDKYMEEYKKKAFFIVKDFQENLENSQTVQIQDHIEKQRDSKGTQKQIQVQERNDIEEAEEAVLMEGVDNNNKEYQEELKEKFKRVRSDICKLLQQHYLRGLTIDEAEKQRVFERAPFKHPHAEEFFAELKNNNVEAVIALLEQDKYLVHDFDCTLSTPMHWAAKRGFMVIAEILIANKADIDGKDEIGRTPLYYAYREGHNEMGKLLLLNKASPWSHDKNNIDQMVFSRLNNDKGTIKVAKQIHLMMMMAKFSQKQKIWDNTKYLFQDKKFLKIKKKHEI